MRQDRRGQVRSETCFWQEVRDQEAAAGEPAFLSVGLFKRYNPPGEEVQEGWATMNGRTAAGLGTQERALLATPAPLASLPCDLTS